jgi:hypothetical protein
MELPKFETNNWIAWEFGLRTKLRIVCVRGEVTLPSPGFTVSLDKAVPQGINPSQLILRLSIVKLPGIYPQQITIQPAFWGEEEDLTASNYDSVLIQLPDGNTVSINEIQKNLPQDDSEDITTYFVPPSSDGGLLSVAVNFFAQYEKELQGGITWVVPYRRPPFYKKYRADLWLTLSHPKINEVSGAIKDCLVGSAVVAAIAAVVAGIVTGGGAIPGAAVGTFKATLVACLTAKGVDFANDISVNLELRNKREV